MFAKTLFAVAALLACVLSGCAKGGPPRFHVSGTITVAGKPVPAGVIFFEPDFSKKNDGPSGFAHVKDGKYDTRTDGRPVVSGPLQVRIHAFDGKPGNELPMGQMIAPEFTTTADFPEEDSVKNFDIPR